MTPVIVELNEDGGTHIVWDRNDPESVEDARVAFEALASDGDGGSV